MSEIQDHRDPIIICKQEDKISNMSENIIEIKTKLIAIEKKLDNHIDIVNKQTFSIVGIVITVFIQVVTFSYLWGGQARQVMMDSERLKSMEDKDVIAQSTRASNVARINNIEERIKEVEIVHRNIVK